MRYQAKGIFLFPFWLCKEFLCQLALLLAAYKKANMWRRSREKEKWIGNLHTFQPRRSSPSEVTQKEKRNALEVIFYGTIKAIKASAGSHWNSVKTAHTSRRSRARHKGKFALITKRSFSNKFQKLLALGRNLNFVNWNSEHFYSLCINWQQKKILLLLKFKFNLQFCDFIGQRNCYGKSNILASSILVITSQLKISRWRNSLNLNLKKFSPFYKGHSSVKYS